CRHSRALRGGTRRGRARGEVRPRAARGIGVTEVDVGAGGAAPRPGGFFRLGLPDVHGSIRGKALRRDAFERAVIEGAVITDLLLALDPIDVPISDYDAIGIRSGAGDLVIRPEPGP